MIILCKNWKDYYTKGEILSNNDKLELFDKMSIINRKFNLYTYIDGIDRVVQKLAKSRGVAITNMHYEGDTLCFIIFKGDKYQSIRYSERKLKLLKLEKYEK